MSGSPVGQLSTRTAFFYALVIGVPLMLSGCAEMQQPGYYKPASASSTTDAIENAEGPYGTQTMRAPSQIQIGFNNRGADAAPTAGSTKPSAQPKTGSSPASAASVAANADSLQASLFPEPLTFAGTLPCFHPEMKCSAQKITISLAPNGRWRARASYLEKSAVSGAPLADQGCWRVIPQAVPRIILLNPAGNVRAELALSASNVLRLISMNGDAVNLTYTLTRQPDLDPINELDRIAAPVCP